jgi:hypothetical protein
MFVVTEYRFFQMKYVSVVLLVGTIFRSGFTVLVTLCEGSAVTEKLRNIAMDGITVRRKAFSYTGQHRIR